MKKLRIVYFGTPSFSARFLEKIISDTSLPIEVIAVVTQPDKPVGKKKIMTASPVKLIAQHYQVPVIESLHKLKSNIDLALLFAYGEIIPANVLSLPKHGFWNIHPSLLPRFRGPSPIAYPLLLGEEKTGVTLMKMDDKIDHGAIIDQAEYIIKPSNTRVDLEKNLSNVGYELFRKNIINLDSDGGYSDQNHKLATFTKLLKRSDGFVPFDVLVKSTNGVPLLYEELPTLLKEYLHKYGIKDHSYHLKFAIYNLFRALSPWPGVFTIVKINGTEKRLKITAVSLKDEKIILEKVHLEGKNETDFIIFNRAYPAIF